MTRLPAWSVFIILLIVSCAYTAGLFFRSYEPAPVEAPPRVNVRWRTDVTTAQRQSLERRHQLAQGASQGAGPTDDSREGRTWSYELRDTTSENIRQLVADPAVEDTAYIDRAMSSVNTRPPAPGLPVRPVLTWGVIALIIAAVATAFGVDTGTGLPSVLTRGIPVMSAEAVGVLRVFFAGALFKALLDFRPVMATGSVEDDGRLKWGWVEWLLARPEIVGRLEDALLVLLVLFGVGILTRVVYAAFVVALSVWIAVLIQLHTNVHVWEVCYLTVVLLTVVPWGRAFSLDELIRRRRGRGAMNVRGQRYGFAVWMPGFLMGAVWLGAAYTKLEVSGPDWILSGAVGYHWVADATLAPVQWGLWVATHHWAAVILSFGAIALEAAFISCAFVRGHRARFMLGLGMGGMLLIGFYLFHGLLWWTWWSILLIFVLPWEAIYATGLSLMPARARQVELVQPQSTGIGMVDTGASAAGHSDAIAPATIEGLRPIHGLLVCVVCLLMLAELPEGFGRFTSYSMTFSSPADFDARTPMKWVNHLWIEYGTPEARALDDVRLPYEQRNIIDALEAGWSLPAAAISELRAVREALGRRFGRVPDRISVVRERAAFDWQAARLISGDRQVVATLDFGSMAFVPVGR